jgi:hypothetical protein
VATGQLFIWSFLRDEWAACPQDEITWLDRGLLSGNEDLALHRAPRCAGLRHVHHRWELFSRDTTYRVYLAPHTGGSLPSADTVQQTASHVLPVAPARYEALPVVLEEGAWLVSVGTWVLPLRLDAAARQPEPAGPRRDKLPTTMNSRILSTDTPAAGSGVREDAVPHVRGYFQRNVTARMAMACYYQEYIRGAPAPHPTAMMDVVIALNLTGEGAVSDYKKLLQGFIWRERGHARDLAHFLLSNALLTPADLDEALAAAADNERRGVCQAARQRLRYRPKEA